MNDERAWPELPWRDWAPTLATLHMWTQIVGKIRMTLTPPLNHWWHITLYVTARGLTTSAIPYDGRYFEIEFDFLRHRLRVSDSDAQSFEIALEPKSVARFYAELMAGLAGIGIDVRISTKPSEVVDAIPFELDEVHASYDADHAQQLWRGLLQADRVLKAYQSGFVGKASPVHFFWGSFDLATSRYSGGPAPVHAGGVANCPDWVMEEAYSREEVSAGWWPSNPSFGPAFYSYTYPEPAGIRAIDVGPTGASFNDELGEFVLPYDAVRSLADPDAAVAEFLDSTYAAGADLADWNRAVLEPRKAPQRPPRESWSGIPERIRER